MVAEFRSVSAEPGWFTIQLARHERMSSPGSRRGSRALRDAVVAREEVSRLEFDKPRESNCGAPAVAAATRGDNVNRRLPSKRSVQEASLVHAKREKLPNASGALAVPSRGHDGRGPRAAQGSSGAAVRGRRSGTNVQQRRAVRRTEAPTGTAPDGARPKAVGDSKRSLEAPEGDAGKPVDYDAVQDKLRLLRRKSGRGGSKRGGALGGGSASSMPRSDSTTIPAVAGASADVKENDDPMTRAVSRSRLKVLRAESQSPDGGALQQATPDGIRGLSPRANIHRLVVDPEQHVRGRTPSPPPMPLVQHAGSDGPKAVTAMPALSPVLVQGTDGSESPPPPPPPADAPAVSPVAFDLSLAGADSAGGRTPASSPKARRPSAKSKRTLAPSTTVADDAMGKPGLVVDPKGSMGVSSGSPASRLPGLQRGSPEAEGSPIVGAEGDGGLRRFRPTAGQRRARAARAAKAEKQQQRMDSERGFGAAGAVPSDSRPSEGAASPRAPRSVATSPVGNSSSAASTSPLPASLPPATIKKSPTPDTTASRDLPVGRGAAAVAAARRSSSNSGRDGSVDDSQLSNKGRALTLVLDDGSEEALRAKEAERAAIKAKMQARMQARQRKRAAELQAKQKARAEAAKARRAKAAADAQAAAKAKEEARRQAAERAAAEAAAADTAGSPDSSAKLERLSQHWGEVQFLLRLQVSAPKDIDATLLAAKDGLAFLDRLADTASRLNVMQGTLSRWLLPYDDNTSTLDQANHSHSAAAAAARQRGGPGGVDFASALSESEVSEMVRAATALRSLVRVKIADDADLGQARIAAAEVVRFFSSLQEHAAAHEETPYDVLVRL